MMEFQLGSISSGTLRNQDLIPAMYSTLKQLGELNRLPSQDAFKYAEYYNEDSMYWATNFALEDFDTLAYALNDCCPAYVVFGANEGDGADFGFWPDIDRINEDIANAEYHNGDDILLLEEMVLVTVNDHGNVTVRDIWSHDILWSCV
jgi:hypothetical protein